MNREIKFRVWNKNVQEFIQLDFDLENYCFGWMVQHDGSSNPNDFIFMQFTGLKDKNGKEIYECDIAKVMLPIGGFWGSVKTERFGIVKYSEDKCRFIVEWNWSKNQHHIDIDCDLDIQVIGNIYQNAELLTKTICQTN